ncbi:MAG: D-glycero-beta-D-manno-heptose 1-phosphate adenylyltransferase [Bdellovibrionales bacterium]|nr:D-glycero-beta-D-manno-heptose 1-phosphate adenylyltransferase [Bdellovibrionales bacterium]
MAKASAPRRSAPKVKSPAALRRLLRKLRGTSAGRKRRVVFTNGCFDLLHPGHISYLEEARRQGDLLVVALNSDDSVRRLKGPSRPIVTLADRMTVIAGLECVDFVTWFEEITPLQLILALRPDVLVKGGDWKVQQIVGGPEILSWGGKVRSLRFVEGKSTTRLVEKMAAKPLA